MLRLLTTSTRRAAPCLATASRGAAADAVARQPALLLRVGGTRSLCIAPAEGANRAASKASADARIERQIAAMAKTRDEQHGIGLVTRRDEFDFPVLAAEERTPGQEGSNASRRLRAAGRLPSVLYGSDSAGKYGKCDRVLCSLSTKAVEDAVRARGLGAENTVLELSMTRLGGGVESHIVTLRDVQWCYVTNTLISANLLRFNKNRKYKIPITTIAEDACVALKAGGWINLWVTALPCRVSEDWRMPRTLSLDLTGVYAKEALTLEQLTLPEGVTPALGAADPATFTIGNVQGKGMAGKRPPKVVKVVDPDYEEDYVDEEDTA